ncbi:MAG: hypothetical protein HQK49_06690 [Oligoflexia bacterium]|nr:hypothetical protein [Oligoflexia bacterium]
MKNVFRSILSALVLSVIAFQVVNAAEFNCPAPSQVNCVPAVNSIGAWFANGGQATGNTFMANNQCANVIHMSNNQSRLVCCYSKCGVFLLDVPYVRCVKRTQSHFICN